MSVLGLSDVKPYLGVKSQISDAEIGAFLDAAEAAIEEKIGPLVATTQTSLIRSPGGKILVLPVVPVISVTSITGRSGTLVTEDSVMPGRAGLVYRAAGFSEDYYTVVYQAGNAASVGALPADVRQLVGLQVKYQWEVMRGQAQRGPDDTRRRIDDLVAAIKGPVSV